jgi:hypothetical protein
MSFDDFATRWAASPESLLNWDATHTDWAECLEDIRCILSSKGICLSPEETAAVMDILIMGVRNNESSVELYIKGFQKGVDVATAAFTELEP